jgi:hypothetical protein
MFVARRLERSGCVVEPLGGQQSVDEFAPAVVGEGGVLPEEAFRPGEATKQAAVRI